MSFISQHTSVDIERALSSVVADTTGSNPATAQTSLTSSWTIPLWTGNAAFVTIENLTTHVASQPFSQLTFDVAAGVESDAAGEMSWDADAETVMLALDDQIHMHIGQDSFYHVINQTGSEIPKGTGVYATGTVGNSGKITVAPFTADGTLNSKYFMGVTAEAIANGATGFVVHFGKLRKINTNAFEEGDILFADPSVAGGLTNVKPAAPNNIITVAIVTTKSATVGQIFVRPTFIDGFADNEDVTVTSATTGDLLRYNGTVWVNYPDSNLASAAGLSTHIADTANPHSVTKSQVGLGNVENTALSTWTGSTNLTTLGVHSHAASDVTSGTFADARIAQSNVTQHQAALSITESQISDLQSYALASHTHDASDVVSGTFSDAYIASASTWNGKIDSAGNGLTKSGTSLAINSTVSAAAVFNFSAIGFDGDSNYSRVSISSFGASLIDDANAAAARATLGLDQVENEALSTWAGSSNHIYLGTVVTGTWNATAIADGYIASAATWNAKIDSAGDGLSKVGTALKINSSATAASVFDFDAIGFDGDGNYASVTVSSFGASLIDDTSAAAARATLGAAEADQTFAYSFIL